MRGIALLIILALVMGVAIREIIERNFETEIHLVQEEAKKAEEAARPPVIGAPQQPAASSTFRGPTGKPYIIGPSGPPPNY